MNDPAATDTTTARRLDEIATFRPRIHDPTYFANRYAPAIRRYVQALLKNEHDAEEVVQEFLLRLQERRWTTTVGGTGRFRDYVKVAARNAAREYQRRKHATCRHAVPLPSDDLQSPQYCDADQQWLSDMRAVLFERAWQAMRDYERRLPQNFAYTVLRLSVDFPKESSQSLAELATQRTGYAMNAATYRQQLSRARRLFAESLVREVLAGMHRPTPESVEDELAAMGLMGYVRCYLPRDWPKHFVP